MGDLRATQDNVILRFLPAPKRTAGGLLYLPDTARPEATVLAEVVAVGPGHYRDSGYGRLVPTTLRPGEVVLVERLAGQDYSLDVSVPRHNKDTRWADSRGEFRIVREDEVLAVVEDEAAE